MKRNKKEKELIEKLEELMGELLKNVKEDFKPKFKIVMETDEEGEGYNINVEGSTCSLLYALSEFAGHLLNKTSADEDDIRHAVEIGLMNSEEE